MVHQGENELAEQLIGPASLRKGVQSDFGRPGLKVKQQPLLQANRRSPSADADVRMSQALLVITVSFLINRGALQRQAFVQSSAGFE